MAFVALYDACVLHPAHLRDLLIRAARTGLVQAKWSTRILDEAIGSVIERRPEHAERLAVTRQKMEAAIRDGVVTGYEALEGTLQLPDPNDRHVLAAAIRSHAQVIVTFNLRDFPADALAPYDIKAQHPDEFLEHLVDLDSRLMMRAVEGMAAPTRNPPLSPSEVLDLLVLQVPRTVEALRRGV